LGDAVVDESKLECTSRLARLHPSTALGAELESLLQRLIDQFSNASPVTSGDFPVVVDLEVEGIRYVVRVAIHASPHSALSPREHEIAHMVGHGLPNKTIAANLGISSWTVSTHLRRMFAKFGVNSRAALVAKILEEELVLQEHRVLRS
jgi:DNA-binding CsgD family transcriptional regulator